jgi:hypothetical protein
MSSSLNNGLTVMIYSIGAYGCWMALLISIYGVSKKSIVHEYKANRKQELRG